MRYGLLRWPLWARGALLAALFGTTMLAAALVVGRRVGTAFVIGVVSGVLYGGGMTAVLASWERRWFAGERPPLTGTERAEVARAVDGVRPPPDDPRLYNPAVRIAQSRLARRSVAWTAVLFGFFGLLAALLAITGSPLWWLVVGFWLVFGPLVIAIDLRGRNRARAFLAGTGERTE